MAQIALWSIPMNEYKLNYMHSMKNALYLENIAICLCDPYT